jgi:hypothetical protein
VSEPFQASFAELLEVLYKQRFTGTITLHMLNGSPLAFEYPAPRISLRRDSVDKSEKVVDAVSV